MEFLTNILKSIFNIFILLSSLILIFFSISTFLIIQSELLSLDFEFNKDGLNKYFSSFSEYKQLFLATITLIVAYFGILRLKAAEIANIEKAKQDRFTEWKSLIEIRISEVEKDNPYLKRQIIKIRYKLFEKLYKKNMSIKNKSELIKICDDEFKKSIRFLEEMNEKYMLRGGIYESNTYTYLYTNFSFVFLGSLDNQYPEIDTDFKKIYLDSLNPNRTIDRDLFQAALRNN